MTPELTYKLLWEVLLQLLLEMLLAEKTSTGVLLEVTGGELHWMSCMLAQHCRRKQAGVPQEAGRASPTSCSVPPAPSVYQL